jgi:hypothetical protein
MHMRAAVHAGMTQDKGIFVHDRELVLISQNSDFVGWHHCHDGKDGTVRLPALGATAGVIVRRLRRHFHNDGIDCTKARELAASEALLG